jgi:Nucleotidyl transferase AbiEii toxin, Type IV TA system
MMTRSYATPLAFKAALEARLRERAAGQGRPFNRVRQLLVMERFLARVFPTMSSAVLKGGLVMELRLDRARATKDVDLRVSVRADQLLDRLQAGGRVDLGDFLAFEVRADPSHPTIEADGLRYDGQRFRAEARLAGRPYGSAFGVDIAVGEPLVGVPQEIDGSDTLAFVGLPPPRFRAYPVETHIAEKLHAYTLPRPRPNSRVKDLPDIALLAEAGVLDRSNVARAIAETFAHRGTHPVPARLANPPEAWAPVYARMAVEDGLPWADLSNLSGAVRAFLDPVLAGVGGEWDPVAWRWGSAEP